MKYYLGFDLGGTFIKFGVVDQEGVIVMHDKLPTPTTYQELLDAMHNAVLMCQVQYPLASVGCSMPGVVWKGKILSSGALTFLNKEHFCEDLRELLQLPVVLVNDANAVCLAEKWLGNAKNYQDFICVTLGTAVGGAMFVNGKLHEGFHGLAGEFGAGTMATHQTSLADCISANCGVVLGACRKYSNQTENKTKDFEEILRRAEHQETLAIATVEEFVLMNGALMYNLALTMGPECILIGGGISQNEAIIHRITAEYQRLAQAYAPIPLDYMPAIRSCKFHNRSGILGAVYAVITGGTYE